MACPSLLAGECSWELWFDQLLCWVSKEQLGWENVICSTLFVTLRRFPQQQKLLNRVGHDILTEEVFPLENAGLMQKCWGEWFDVDDILVWKKSGKIWKMSWKEEVFSFFKPVTFPPGSFRTRKQDYHLFLFYFGTSGWIPSSSPFFLSLYCWYFYEKALNKTGDERSCKSSNI